MSILVSFDESLQDCGDVFDYFDDAKQTALVLGLVQSISASDIASDDLHGVEIAYCEEVSTDPAMAARRVLSNVTNSGDAEPKLVFLLDVAFSVSELYPLEAGQVCSACTLSCRCKPLVIA
jgi:hypothetical protein